MTLELEAHPALDKLTSKISTLNLERVRQIKSRLVALSRDSHGIHTSTTHSATGKQLDVEELEMLLEAYFVQIDGTLNKLSTVCNYINGLSLFSHCMSPRPVDLHPAIPFLG
jgi:hypothetical protein